MTDTRTDADTFFAIGGGRTAKFENPGDTITGTVIGRPVLRQQTKVGTNTPLVWDDGSPRMEAVVTLQTAHRDDPDDDGRRRLFVRGNMRRAIAEAVHEAGAPGVRDGGQLTVKYLYQAAPTKPGLSGEKKYAAEYKPPTDAFLTTPNDTPAPVSAAEPAPAGAVPSALEAAARAAGVDPAAFAALLAMQQGAKV